MARTTTMITYIAPSRTHPEITTRPEILPGKLIEPLNSRAGVAAAKDGFRGWGVAKRLGDGP